MKFFNTTQIKSIDQYTIQHEPIDAIQLMERAAENLLQFILKKWDRKNSFIVLAGSGNNGGDGLALARMMIEVGYRVKVILFHKGKLSADCETNKKQLKSKFPTSLVEQQEKFRPFKTTPKTIIIDALFGVGLSKPIEGFFADIIHFTNQLPNTKIAIDIPSGIFGETTVQPLQVALQADYTLTIQFPKLAFFFAENEKYIGTWYIIDIQLHPKGITQTKTPYHYLQQTNISQIHKNRQRFSHKGNYGHILLYAGSKGMAGAAILATKAALRTGAGLVTLYSNKKNRNIAQTTIPEAIFTPKLPNTNLYNAFGIGCGIGKGEKSTQKLRQLLTQIGQQPIVLDADALNIIAKDKKLLQHIPHNSILTPHPKEFERIFGKSNNSSETLQKAIKKAQQHQFYIVLKTAYTITICPNGDCYFNSTGNAGMATGGMGDALTGIIVSLMAQGYSTKDSALMGVFIHGMAADIALQKQSQESLLPSDLIEHIGDTFKQISLLSPNQ